MHRHWRLTEEVVFTEIEGFVETEGFPLLLTEEKSTRGVSKALTAPPRSRSRLKYLPSLVVCSSRWRREHQCHATQVLEIEGVSLPTINHIAP